MPFGIAAELGAMNKHASTSVRFWVACVCLVLALGCQHGFLPDKSLGKPSAGLPPVHPFPDLSTVAGRRICLDPGHGGPWPGAVAPRLGLRECDVNLAVALRLRKILEEAGAEVVLTREGDDALDETSLVNDLAARAALAEAAHAEAFLSIHHNASVERRSRKNDLEVYYKFGEEGPSLDLAQCLIHALALWLRQDAEAKRLLPGNYRVLRGAETPAVLLESSYMTNRKNAAYLAKQRGVEAEARAVAAGLALYFALDPPQFGSLDAIERDSGQNHQIRGRFTRGLPIEEVSIEVLLNGTTPSRIAGQAIVADSEFIWTFAEPLPNGVHVAQVRARNRRGATAVAKLPIVVDRPPAFLNVQQRPRVKRGSGAEVLWEVTVLDPLGMPVRDGTTVIFRETGDCTVTKRGKARFYVLATEVPQTLTFAAGAVCAQTDLKHNGEPVYTVRCLDARTGRPVPGVVVLSGVESVTVATEEGWFSLPHQDTPGGGDDLTVRLVRRGYEPAAAALREGHAYVMLEPIDEGVFHGRRVVLDPAHGGRNPGATGPTGMRGSDINLDVARRLAALLCHAGAEVVLTRDKDIDAADLARLAVAMAENADVFVTISYGMSPAESLLLDQAGLHRTGPAGFVGHYPGSDRGARLAGHIAAALVGVPVAQSAAYLLQQTPCPAVLVQPASLASKGRKAFDVEDHYRNVESRRKDAEALYAGLLAYFRG